MAVPEASQHSDGTRRFVGWIERVGADWWATALGLAVTALAVSGVLPKISW